MYLVIKPMAEKLITKYHLLKPQEVIFTVLCYAWQNTLCNLFQMDFVTSSISLLSLNHSQCTPARDISPQIQSLANFLEIFIIWWILQYCNFQYRLISCAVKSYLDLCIVMWLAHHSWPSNEKILNNIKWYVKISILYICCCLIRKESIKRGSQSNE